MFLSLLLSACTPGSIVLGGGGGDSGSPDDTGGEDPHPHAGTYSGSIAWWMDDWDWVICDGEDIDVEINAVGEFSSSGLCVYYGQYDDYDMAIELDGSVTEEGEVTGEISWETWAIYSGYELETITADLEGTVDDGELDAEFEADAYMGDYGDYPVNGAIQADLE
ncbi:MAG TPA: hypothetical protein QGF58_25870 [Myxococcota bacterium]|nr:hypothetical protein [Myxococcota bacterium]